MSKKIWRLSLILLVVAIFVSGCTFPWKKKPAPVPNGQNFGVSNTSATSTDSVNATSTNAVRKFTDYAALKKFLTDNNNPGASSGSLVSQGMAEGMITRSLAPSASTGLATDKAALAPSAADSSQPNSSLDYSTTNNQVAGVDEADIIKTDGSYIYALVRNELLIIKAVPASAAQIISKITLADRPQDIFINGTSLAVFGSDNQIYAQPLYKTFRRQNAYTFFKVFDLSDPANPQQVRDLKFEGNYADARLINDYVYLITSTYNNYLATEPLVPRVIDNGQVLSQDCAASSRCFAPAVYYFDMPYESYNYTNIAAINIKNNSEAISGQDYLMNNNQNLYVSANNIYLTYTQYINEYDLEQDVKRRLVYPQLTPDDQSKITQIEATPNFVLNKYEKRSKAGQIIDTYLGSLTADSQTSWQGKISDALKLELAAKAQEMETTVIHKISISGNKIEYKAMGQVNGQVLNQFSMDENGAYFRLATTRNQQSSQFLDQATDSYSNVYVLDSDLKVVGRLENLATTERIYAARFFGDRVYLVTFKQTDPLYVIGLSDPTKPTVLGAVKISGYSNYLHPVDANGTKLIGLGRDATVSASGQVTVKGLKLSLYDFSDLTKPKELDSYLIGDSSSDSIALTDHHAFLYSAAKNIVVIPATLSAGGQLNFAGALVFSLLNNSFTLKGRLDHSAGGNFTQADYWDGYNYYDNSVKRSLYINDNLYTFSNKFLKINGLADLAEVKSLTLTAGGSDYIITPGGVPGSPGGAPSFPNPGSADGYGITGGSGAGTGSSSLAVPALGTGTPPGLQP